MKRITAVLLVLALITLPFLMGAIVETAQETWEALRASDVTASDPNQLDGTTAGRTYQFIDKPRNAVAIRNSWNAVEVVFYGTNAADLLCNYKVWVWKENGPARLACSGSFTLGAALRSTGVYYADTISVTSATCSSAVLDAGAADRVATLVVGDVRGSKWIHVEFTFPGTTPVVSVNGIFTGY